MADDYRAELNQQATTLLFISMRLWPLAACSLAVLICFFIYSSYTNASNFLEHLLEKGPVDQSRIWSASIVLVIGLIAQIFYLLVIFGGISFFGVARRTAFAFVPLMLPMLLPMVLLFRAMFSVMGLIIPTGWLWFFAKGPLSIGQGIGGFLGLLFGPLLYTVGIAKGILTAGDERYQVGCSVLKRVAETGLLDFSSLLQFVWSLIKVFFSFEILEKLGYEMIPEIFSFNWWASITLTSRMIVGGEMLACYTSGSL